MARDCGCGNEPVVIAKEDGSPWPRKSNVVVIPDYGDHPGVKPLDDSTPFTVNFDDVNNCWVLGFNAQDDGCGQLLGPDGSVLFVAPKCDVNLNGAGGGSVAGTVSGGLKVTKLAGGADEFSVELCLDEDNPPPFQIVNGKIAAL